MAEGTSTDESDLDVKVVVSEDSACENINHPTFDDYKLDITFRSFRQIEQFTRDEVRKGEREPNLVCAVILFDKTGDLTRLQAQVRDTKRPKCTPEEYQLLQFILYHANNKVERVLQTDPAASLYSMHANIGEVLKVHFKLNDKWWVSSKNILKSLDSWDRELAELVRDFVSTAGLTQKYQRWSVVLDHVAKPMGGRQPIAENNCQCDTCRQDLGALA